MPPGMAGAAFCPEPPWLPSEAVLHLFLPDCTLLLSWGKARSHSLLRGHGNRRRQVFVALSVRQFHSCHQRKASILGDGTSAFFFFPKLQNNLVSNFWWKGLSP